MSKKNREQGVSPQHAAADELAAELAAQRAAGSETDADSEGVDLGPIDLGPDPTAELRAELAEAQNRLLRSHAELENYRKRAARELQDERRYGSLPLMRDLLPVLDNIERAIDAADQGHDAAGLLEGVKMVARQMQDALARHDCMRIEALHQPFNPHLHEAISQQPTDEHPTSTVILVTQTGYQLGDRVVRPSQVIVSTLPPEAPMPSEEAAAE